ncbi:MAG: transcriptional regulator GcvA [Burkholderiales bacterium]|nr:transcriptional regulator GcvA [Burkholderiales bacterium]
MATSQRTLPPLEFLRGFEAAARHLSFTRAAGELFLTQSAVSRQIQALEAFVGMPLFERRHKALALTPAGDAYYRTVTQTLDVLREATRRLKETRTGHVLTVTTTVSFAALWLVPRLSHFRKERPNVDVRITATHEVVDLEREGIDVAIRDCPLARVPPGAIFLVGEHLMPVCSPEYVREARRGKLPLAKPADLRHHLLLNLHDVSRRWPWLSWAAWFEARGIDELTPASTLTFDQYDQVLQAAVHGQGIALGRMTLAAQYIRDKRLVALFGTQQRLARGFHAVFARNAGERSEARRFVDWIRAEIARDSAMPPAAPGGASIARPRPAPRG